MKMHRTQNTLRNIRAGLVLRCYQMAVPFLMRTAMIHLMGVEYLGLSGLFSSILHVLNLAELGVGVAMVFSMYKPVAEDDAPRICALMGLYRRYYRLIGLFIGGVGLLLTPLVPRLISGELPGDVNVYTLYLLNLGATVLSYWLFAYRNCLLTAHQRRDIASLIMLGSNILQHVLQLLVLLWWRNYYLYVIISLLCTALNNVVTGLVTMRLYPTYHPQGTLEAAEVKQINGRIRDLFTAKLGSVVLQYADTIVLSAFMGLTAVAVYQNYYFILTAVIAMIEMLISSMTAGLGNSFVTESKEKNYRDLLKFTFLFLWLTGVCTCCFIGMYQPFMENWVGEELMLPFGMVLCFALYFYAYTLNRLLSIYKDAAGLWHRDRFNPLVSAMLNLMLNLMLIKPFGLYGVLLSTVISLVLVSIPWQMHNLFTGFFERNALRGWMRVLLSCAGATIASGGAVWLLCGQISASPWMKLCLCTLVSAVVPNVIFLVLLRRSAQFRPAVLFADRMTKGRFKLENRLL